MQELLSKTDDPKPPIHDSDFYELRLIIYELRSSVSDFAAKPIFCVRKAHARWDDADKAIAWDIPDIWAFGNIQEAKDWYQGQRLALVERGFIYSNMDR